MFSRFLPLLLVRAMVHVGDTARSKSKPLADQITRSQLAGAAAWCFFPLAIIALGEGLGFVLLGVLFSAVAAALLARWFWQRLQGFTGDCLGAVQQLSEIGFYLGAALALGPLVRGASV